MTTEAVFQKSESHLRGTGSDLAVQDEPSVCLVDDVSGLSELFEPRINIAHLQRRAQHPLAGELKSAAEKLDGKQQFIAHASNAFREIRQELPTLSTLADDIAYWSEVIADISGARSVGVRLARLDQAMCPRFHVDRVTVRFVVTYWGPGTEFISSEHVDRRYLGSKGLGLCDKVGGLMLAPNCVRQAASFDILALKGELWPGNAGRGAVHRSPWIPSRGDRLVMTLDPL